MISKKETEKSLKELSDQSGDLFARSLIPFNKGKEEVWVELSGRIRQNPARSAGTIIRVYPGRQWIGIAASVVLLVSVTALMRFYRVTTTCPPGSQVSEELPDGSIAELNGPATISVHPLWWPFFRKIDMEGEAFFNVTEGRRFRVYAPQGTTEVLGTTFYIFAREGRFEVTCHSGRVQVSAFGSESLVTLSQDQKAELIDGGSFEISQVTVDRVIPEWRGNLMMFTSTPLRQVFDMIERQYGIRIETPPTLNYIYSGRFARNQPVENILSLVCRPFNLEYERKSASEYRVYPAAIDQ